MYARRLNFLALILVFRRAPILANAMYLFLLLLFLWLVWAVMVAPTIHSANAGERGGHHAIIVEPGTRVVPKTLAPGYDILDEHGHRVGQVLPQTLGDGFQILDDKGRKTGTVTAPILPKR